MTFNSHRRCTPHVYDLDLCKFVYASNYVFSVEYAADPVYAFIRDNIILTVCIMHIMDLWRFSTN